MSSQPENLRPALLAVKELLKTPATWMQHHLAQNKEGYFVFPNDPGACRWCLLGAIEKVGASSPFNRNELRRCLMTTLRARTEYLMLSSFNDLEDFDAVHHLLDSAIETAL